MRIPISKKQKGFVFWLSLLLLLWFVVFPILKALGKLANGVGSGVGALGDIVGGVSSEAKRVFAQFGLASDEYAGRANDALAGRGYWSPTYWEPITGVKVTDDDLTRYNAFLTELSGVAHWYGFDSQEVLAIFGKYVRSKFDVSYLQYIETTNGKLFNGIGIGSSVSIPAFLLSGWWSFMSNKSFVEDILTFTDALPES